MKCYFVRNADIYTIGNQYIERAWEYDGQNLHTVSIKDKKSGHEWVNSNWKDSENTYEGLTYRTGAQNLHYPMNLIGIETHNVLDSIYSGPYLETVFHLKNDMYGIEVKLHSIVYENVPAIRTFLEIKSQNLPKGYFYDNKRFNALDSYPVKVSKKGLTSFEFYTRTDHTNKLVEKRAEPWGCDKGNLLFYCLPQCGGFFILKESPCFSDQRPETEGNFYIETDRIQTLGWGIRPEELTSDRFRKTYSSVIGTFEGDYNQGLMALKKYQKSRASMIPERDYMIMANPWGDRQCMEHMGEDFVLSELEACEQMGITHYQLDDGWQKGNGLIHLVNNEAIDSTYWEIDKERFPNAFEKVVVKARKSGVELALWFAPDFNRLFRNYKEQASMLYVIYKKYNIRKFKIDGVQLRNKESEENLESLLKILRDKSNGDITFNLDTTADARAGYFMFQEYGNIFLENRYTDWKNYYPYLTLKNLWDLCPFVPLQKLQIEFLNIDRNADKYDVDDELAPRNYSYEYIFAITMFANPLCWFEPSAMAEKSRKKLKPMIELYKSYRDEIFRGQIFPLGERPSGHSWTGFQSHNPEDKSGFFIVYREKNPYTKYSLKLLFIDGMRVSLQSISDETGEITIDRYKRDKGVEIILEAENSFRMYKYKIL